MKLMFEPAENAKEYVTQAFMNMRRNNDSPERKKDQSFDIL